jgi:inorganic pyrophosphatase
VTWIANRTGFRLIAGGEPRRVPEQIDCVVEIPKGSRNKYEWDEEAQAMRLDRFLSSSVAFPTDYGFVHDTIGPDGGDPLDVLVAVSEPTFPGCRVFARPVAVLKMRKDGEPEEKVLAVPCDDPGWQDVHDLDGVPRQLRDEIAEFFPTYLHREGAEVELDGWEGADSAAEVIETARRRYADQHAATTA